MRSSRLPLISIPATGVFHIASFVALGKAFPTFESSGEEIIAWFSANGPRARVYAWIAAFVSFGLAVFAGQVAALLPRPHGYVFFAGVMGFALTAQVQGWLWAGLAAHP